MALCNISSRDEFEERVLKNKKTVLVDFWAEWCPPCHAMAPVLHELGQKHDDIVDIVKIDVEGSIDNHKLAEEYQVQSIPNMIIFADGEIKSTVIGAVPKSYIIAEIEKASL